MLTRRKEKNKFVNCMALLVKDLSEYPPLTPEKEIELIKKIKNGDLKAKELFIKSNLRLIGYCAKYYQAFSLDYSDLIQEGYFGLVKAVDAFDLEKGVKFSTYAVIKIRREIQRAIQNLDNIIRIPVNVCEVFEKYDKDKRELTDKIGAEPCIEDMMKYCDISLEKAMKNEELYQYVLPLIVRNVEGEETYITDFACSWNPDLETDFMNNVIVSGMKDIIETSFSSRNAKIIFKRLLTLSENADWTSKEIGEEFGLSDKSVTLISRKSITLLKSKLKDYKYIEDHSEGEPLSPPDTSIDYPHAIDLLLNNLEPNIFYILSNMEEGDEKIILEQLFIEKVTAVDCRDRNDITEKELLNILTKIYYKFNEKNILQRKRVS